MGDTSPKNQKKRTEQKREEQIQKDHGKLENAAHQHHPDRALTPEEVVALKEQEKVADAARAGAAE
jgi:hypothetical protein